MLKLENVDNQVELELAVIDYESPDSLTSNWCLIKAIVIQGNEMFEVVFPALETTDLIRISEWFQRLAEYKLPRFAHLSFTEPCIEFQFLACTEHRVRISINLCHEMKPTFKLNQFNLPFDDPDWNIIFELNADNFQTIIGNIKKVIEQYPARNKK
jgi:hypothetical protein